MQLHEAQNIKYKDTIDKLCRAVFGLDIQETQTLSSKEWGKPYNLISEVNNVKAQVGQLVPDEFRNRIVNLIKMDSQVQIALNDYVEPIIRSKTNFVIDEYMRTRNVSSNMTDEDKQMLCDYVDMQVRYMLSEIIRQGNLRVSFNNNGGYY